MYRDKAEVASYRKKDFTQEATEMDQEKTKSKQAEAEERFPSTNSLKETQAANDVEASEELNGSDFRSAFKNPVTGEERLY